MSRKMFFTQMSGGSRMETHGLGLILWASLSGAFSLDTERPLTYTHKLEGFCSYSVHRSESGDTKRIVVEAPLERNSTGEMYGCTSDLQSCTALQRPECTKREVNLVFLVDGSRSMRKDEFELNKYFIKDVIKKLSNSSIKFAAVQFGGRFRTIFDFNDYQNGAAEQKLMEEKHMSYLTHTYGAIKYSLDNLLNDVSSGANPNAQKALVIITDGNPTDSDTHNIISKCEEQNVLRYVIGVGMVDLLMLYSLASEPIQSNTFYIQNYDGLKGLLDDLQKKIYIIEGSKEGHSNDGQKELSQRGFSVVHQTSCSPYLSHECDGNSYLNGVCYQFDSSSQPVSNITAAYQECSKREVNLVFLVDGSRSMKKDEFELNKYFIKDVMKKLSDSSIKFAAVQFGGRFRTIFDFNDYQNSTAEQKLMEEKHMSYLTHTYGAIKYSLDNLLNDVSSGANPNAQKALVIITDGNPTDSDNHNIIEKCEEQNVLRYVIGVGYVDLAMLYSLASEPKQNNTFYIQNYDGLKGLLDNLQKKIFTIEGSKEGHSNDRQKELSQRGFIDVQHERIEMIKGICFRVRPISPNKRAIGVPEGCKLLLVVRAGDTVVTC